MGNETRPNLAALRHELTCGVCQELYDRPQSLMPCLHTICLDCANYISRSDSSDSFPCPICRSRVSSYSSNFTIRSVTDLVRNLLLEVPEVAIELSNVANDDSSTREEPGVEIIEGLSITDDGPSSSASSYQSVSALGNTKNPCRSCAHGNNTDYTCPTPVTDERQDGFGHLFCCYCQELMPARGQGGNEPALNQCCSFCGIVACDEYWGCDNGSDTAKLYILNEIEEIYSKLTDVDTIENKEDGHLNQSEIDNLGNYLRRHRFSWSDAWRSCLDDFNENVYVTPIARKMTALGHQIYNTRRLTVDGMDNTDSDEEFDAFYNSIDEEGIKPSEHLRACYSCLVTVVNGQFYGYWKQILNSDSLERVSARTPCTSGIQCETQWRTPTHAERLSHIDVVDNRIYQIQFNF